MPSEPLTPLPVSAPLRAAPRPGRLAWEAFARDPLAVVGAVFLLMVLVISLAAQWVSPYDPLRGFDTIRLAAPLTPGHLLGTDGQGRDLLSRLVWGGRVSLASALLPELLVAPFALILGLLAGYWGKWADQIIMRSLDVLFAFPMVLLAIAIGGTLGPSLWTPIVAIGIALLPYMSRVVYNNTQTVKQAEFVEAARAVGANSFEIMRAEILPNILPTFAVYVSSILGPTLVVAAGLSFFGLGVRPPAPDWGSMIRENRIALAQAPGASLFPGLMIVLVSLAFAYVGIGLRNMLDPYLHE